jgi:diacylglycerol kinase (ATP)
MGKKIGIVLNPRSRYLRRNPAAIGRLHLMVGDRGLVAESKDLEHIKRVGEDFLAAGVEVIGIAGGDGTAGITIKAFDEVYRKQGKPMPPIALLRGGTMNTVSNALKLGRGTPEKNLQNLLSATSGSMPASIECNTLIADGRVGFLFGTGVFQSFLREYYKRGNDDPSAVTAAETIGAMAASAIVQGPLIKSLARPQTMTLEVDGQRFEPTPYMAVTAGTVEQVGLGFSPFYLADRFRGAFHLLAITGTPSTVVRDLPRVWLGLPMKSQNGMNFVGKRAVLTATEPIDYMVDGDLYTCNGPLVVEAGPMVRILRVPR